MTFQVPLLVSKVFVSLTSKLWYRKKGASPAISTASRCNTCVPNFACGLLLPAHRQRVAQPSATSRLLRFPILVRILRYLSPCAQRRYSGECAVDVTNKSTEKVPKQYVISASIPSLTDRRTDSFYLLQGR